jgi:hypothetical protein
MPRVDKETLQRFRDEGKTLKEAADHFGVPYRSMPYWCRKYGIVFRGNGGQLLSAKERVAKPSAKVVEEKLSQGNQDKLNDLYKQVTQIRFHQRRLAYKEKQLLQAISEMLGGSIPND